ncbi:MAG: tail fiber domain-containing protein [Bacteroidota bacterium]
MDSIIPPANSIWIQKQNAPFVGVEGAVSFSINGKAYVGAGRIDEFNTITNEFWEYDTESDSWTQKANVPGGGRWGAVGFSINGKGYIGTGVTSGGFLSKDFWEYDPDTDSWTSIEPFPYLTTEAVSFTINNRAFVVGPSSSSECWEYDPMSGWIQRETLPDETRSEAFAFSLNGKGYVGAGFTGVSSNSDYFYQYDPTTDTWTRKADFPDTSAEGFWNASAFTLDGKGYVASGSTVNFTLTEINPTSFFYEYDPNSDAWLQRDDFPGPARHGAVGFTVNNRAYISTGLANDNNNFVFLNDLWEFNNLTATPIYQALNPSNGVLLPNSFILDTDSDTRIQLEESADEDVIRFDVAGTEAVLISSNGNVGIGITTPSSALDVRGRITADSLSGDGSNLTNVPGDDLGNHSATTNLQLAANWLSGDGDNEGVYINDSGRVGIGTNTPNPSAKLEVSATDAGFLPPRMTSAQRAAIINPATGLLVYQTDIPKGLFEYDGTRWNLVASLSNGSLTTEPPTNGSTILDANQPLANTSGVTIGSGGVWQSFTAENTGFLKEVEIGYAVANGPPSGSTIRIYEGEGTNGLLLTSQSFPPANTTGFIRYAFSNPVGVSAGQKYTLWVADPSAGWDFRELPGPYAGGRPSALIFEIGLDYDFTFRTYVTSVLSLLNANPISGDVGISNDRLYIASNGNVGIGTTSPQSRLDIEGGLTVGSSYSGTNTAPANGAIIEGNVGIGTNTPNSSLEVNGNIALSNANLPMGLTTEIPDPATPILNLSVNALLPNVEANATGGLFRIDSRSAFLTPLFQWLSKPSGQVGPSNEDILMVLNEEGNLGIGTFNPIRAKLEVIGFNTSNVGPYGFLGSAGNTGTATALANYSIYADARIAAFEFNAFSDARIKSILGISNSQDDLATLMGIQITDYQHIDTIQQGTDMHKKVIAQQVAEVFPQAVTTSTTEVIPDIYQRANLLEGWIELATDLRVGDRVKIITETGNDIHEVIAVEDSRFQLSGLQTTASVSGDTSAIPSTPYQVPRTLFVYGRQINDFHTVDYEAISMLNVSATQEQQRRIEALEAENAQLQRQNEAFENRLSQIEARLQGNSISRADK